MLAAMALSWKKKSKALSTAQEGSNSVLGELRDARTGHVTPTKSNSRIKVFNYKMGLATASLQSYFGFNPIVYLSSQSVLD